VGLGRGPLSLVITTEELLGRNSNGSGLESREYGRRDPSRWRRDNLYQQKLALTLPTSSFADSDHGVLIQMKCAEVARWVDREDKLKFFSTRIRYCQSELAFHTCYASLDALIATEGTTNVVPRSRAPPTYTHTYTHTHARTDTQLCPKHNNSASTPSHAPYYIKILPRGGKGREFSPRLFTID
jgi:hypothetical protein